MSEEIITAPAVVEKVIQAEPITPLGKVFTEEYVSSLREESKNHRLTKKQRETQLRSILGLKEEDDITDAAIAAYKQSTETQIQTALAKANDRLISAAIRELQGYDSKLLERLIDKSKLTITDTGEVEGIKEAAEVLEKEFPQIKKLTDGIGVNPRFDNPNETERLKAAYDDAIKNGRTAEAVSLKNKLFALTKL